MGVPRRSGPVSPGRAERAGPARSREHYGRCVVLGLMCALTAAACYGVGSVLQAMAAHRTTSSPGLDPRLMLRLVRSWRYVVGVGLDGLGFVLTLVAVRTLPLYLVQCVVAGFLAVTAVLGALVLRTPLSRAERLGVVVVVAGLVLVGLSAAADRPVEVGGLASWAVLAAVLALAGISVPVARLSGARAAGALGAVAGLAFGTTSVAARMLAVPHGLSDPAGSARALLTSPAFSALVLAGALAMLTYSTALQRGTVAAATAMLVVGETVVPALVGVLVLGDRPRAGWGPLAALGFALAVAGALSLARHGEPVGAAPEP